MLCLQVNRCCAAGLSRHAGLQAEVSGAHEGGVSTMAWHPLGHMLATGSNDLTIRFWTSSKASSGRQRQQTRSNAAVPEGETLPSHDVKHVKIVVDAIAQTQLPLQGKAGERDLSPPRSRRPFLA